MIAEVEDRKAYKYTFCLEVAEGAVGALIGWPETTTSDDDIENKLT